MSHSTKHFYEFGSFRLDTGERILLCEGQLVPLTPKAFETLLVLVESNGRIIDKEELLNKVWPDTFVEEVSLAKKVSILRKLLGEDFNHHYIETIPRRGYRFVAEVREVWEESQAQTLTNGHDEAGRTPQTREEEREAGPAVIDPLLDGAYNSMPNRHRTLVSRLVWAGGFVACGLSAGLMTWRAGSGAASKASKHPLNAVPLTSFQGRESQAAFSPDGSQIAFVWNGPQGNNSDIYVKLVDAETPLRLTTNAASDTKPVWSPDGRYIAFLREAAEGSAFYLIPALGGAERKLADIFPSQIPR